MSEAQLTGSTALRVAGSAVVYRLYDIGYEVRLDRLPALLPSDSVARTRPTRSGAKCTRTSASVSTSGPI